MKGIISSIGKFLQQTKLFWGLAVLYLVGVFSSPINHRGVNIFLSPGNQSDVLRQVSNNGIIAVGMTLVILTGGIDLSVGSMMALGSVVCAMLLTQQGWTNASLLAIPILALVTFFLCAYLVPLIAINATRGSSKPVEKAHASVRWCGIIVGAILAILAVRWTAGQLAIEIWRAWGVSGCSRGGACFWSAQWPVYHQGQNAALHCNIGDDGGNIRDSAPVRRIEHGGTSCIHRDKCHAGF